MTKRIEFVDSSGQIPEAYYPIAAVNLIPEWYKQTPGYTSKDKIPDRRVNVEDTTGGTIKRCRPVFDAISAGYLLRLPVDVNVRFGPDGHWYEWPDGEPILFHATKQAPIYPQQENRKQAFPKFSHPWIVKTPTGYSSLFTTPTHRDLPFHTLEGIVDTDTYHSPVSLPFVFKNPEWEGLLKAGTPIAQVIPIKRDSWRMKSRSASESDKTLMKKVDVAIKSVFNDGYQKFFWQRKNYR